MKVKVNVLLNPAKFAALLRKHGFSGIDKRICSKLEPLMPNEPLEFFGDDSTVRGEILKRAHL